MTEPNARPDTAVSTEALISLLEAIRGELHFLGVSPGQRLVVRIEATLAQLRRQSSDTTAE